MSTAQRTDAPAAQMTDFARAYGELRESADLQFAPVPPPDQPPPPDWLLRLLDWLGEALAPLTRLLAGGWPVIVWLLVAAAIAVLAFFAWRMLAESARPVRGEPADEAIAPERAAALALLEDADRLAAQGRYDEAAHLLLVRSVAQIAAIRPDLLEPSSTAREIAQLAALPAAARTAFVLIAGRVERSRFALHALKAEDWVAARAAYADFALARAGLAA